MEKNILILCCGYPYARDAGFGYHVSKVLEKMKLPKNVEFLEVGGSACMVPGFVEGKEKMIVVDIFKTKDRPGTIVRLKPEEVPVTVGGVTDIDKAHLFEMLDQIKISGKCPETIFIGVVPKDTKTASENLSPDIENKIPEVIDLIMKAIEE
jgi:hydrogenase maturation protease